MKTAAEVCSVCRRNLAKRFPAGPQRRIGRPPLPDEELVAQISAAIAELPTLRLPAASRHHQALGAASYQPPFPESSERPQRQASVGAGVGKSRTDDCDGL